MRGRRRRREGAEEGAGRVSHGPGAPGALQARPGLVVVVSRLIVVRQAAVGLRSLPSHGPTHRYAIALIQGATFAIASALFILTFLSVKNQT